MGDIGMKRLTDGIYTFRGRIEDVENDYLLRVQEKLKHYEDLEESGRLIELPCAIGDEVYVITACESISAQLDGTLWGADGGYGTATGYYCPYENECPHEESIDDFCDCLDYKNKNAIFKDYVNSIIIDEFEGITVNITNCNNSGGNIGEHIFLTHEEAEKRLEEME